MSTPSAYQKISFGEWLGVIETWGVILGDTSMLVMVVEAENEKEVEALLTSKIKELLVEGMKLVLNLRTSALH